jgi:flagellar motility protein MotE (MotC chaperone)
VVLFVRFHGLVQQGHNILFPELAAQEDPKVDEKKDAPSDSLETAEEEKKTEKKEDKAATGKPVTPEDIIAADKRLSAEKPATVEPRYSQAEIDILQRLSLRRKQLEEWESELKERENMLNLSQSRIQERIEEMRGLRQELHKRLKEYESKNEEKTKSLVRIYENMKPKDAARIFSEMDLPILLDVVRGMKERSAAPIIAKMDADKAKQLTEAIAKKGQLPEALPEIASP